MLSPVKGPEAAVRKVPVVRGGKNNKASINRNEGCKMVKLGLQKQCFKKDEWVEAVKKWGE